MEIKYYLQIILRRKLIFISVLLLTVLIPVFLCLSKAKIYSASAQIMINQKDIQAYFHANTPNAIGEIAVLDSDAIFERYLERLENETVINEALSQLNYKDEKASSVKSRLPYLTFLFSSSNIALNIERVAESDLYKIEAYASTPQEAADLANSVVDSFLKHCLEINKNLLSDLAPLLEKNLQQLEEKLVGAEVGMQEFIVKSSTSNPDLQLNLLQEQLGDYQNQLSDIDIELASYKQTQTNTLKTLNEMPEYQKYSESLAKNPRINELKNSLANLQLQLVEAKVDFTDAHPTISGIKQQINKTEEILTAEVDTTFSAKVMQRNDQYSSWQERYWGNEISILKVRTSHTFIKKKIDELKKQITTISIESLQYNRLTSDLNYYLDELIQTRKALDSVNFAKQLNISNFFIINQANTISNNIDDETAYFPSLSVTIVFASFFGFIFALFSSFFYDYIDESIHSGKDLKKIITTSTCMTLPRVRKLNTGELISGNFSTKNADVLSSNLGNILNINTTLPKDKIIGIASTNPQEGKTTTALLLANACILNGEKVLFVESNINNSSSSKTESLPQSISLDNFLSLKTPFAEKVASASSGLTIISARPNNATTIAELFLKIISLLDTALESPIYDRIIIECPSYAETNASLMLATKMDYLFLVSRLGKVKRDTIDTFYTELSVIVDTTKIAVVCWS